MLSNLRAHLTFITILLAFCCFPALSAIASSDRLPATLHELLQSNTPDLSAVVSELKDIDLPAALAVAEILKFKALHQDTAITAEQINKFELLIKSRLTDPLSFRSLKQKPAATK